MHARILLPTLFAATLVSTAALADRTDNDDRPTKSSVKERMVRERAPEARERVQTREAPARHKTERAAPSRLAEKRGCATEDGGSCSSKRDVSDKTVTQTKSSKASAPPMPTKLQTQRGCATDDGSGCATKSEKKATETTSSSGMAKHVVEKSNRWSQPVVDEIMRLRRQIEAERLLDMLNIRTCARKGTCGEDAY